MKFKLKLAEIGFMETLASINDTDTLIKKIKQTLKENLTFDTVTVFQRHERTDTFIGPFGYQFKVGDEIEKLLFRANHFVDRYEIESNSYYSLFREKFIKAFELIESRYMIPLFQDKKLYAVFFLPESSEYIKMSADEINFANNILAAASNEMTDSEKFDDITQPQRNP
jgi:hypothetical protein